MMLERVAARLRSAASFHAIAYAVIEELAARGLRSALVLCDASGAPALWIGDFERAVAQAYLDGGHRADPSFARICARYLPTREGRLWSGPILGTAGVIGMLRVATDDRDTSELTMIVAYVAIRLALLGLTFDHVCSIGALTPRQREVAELVTHGCTNIEIGRMLDISPNAVKKHVSRVLEMFGVSNRTELAALTGRWPAAAPDPKLPARIEVVFRNPSKSDCHDLPA